MIIPVLLGILVVLFAYVGFLLFERSRVFKPTLAVDADPTSEGLAFEETHFVAEDGALLHGWWIEAEGARATVLYFHGSAGNIADRIETAKALHRLGLHIFLFDYRGYGRSKGFASEQGTYRDARAAYEVVRAKYADTNEPPVVLYGRSLGAAVAMHLAGERHTLGIVIEAAFTSIPDLGSELYPALPVRRFGRIKYESLSRIRRLHMPKLIAHSRDDIFISPEHGQRLYEAAPEPKRFAELRGAHGDPGWIHTPGYWEILDTFIANITK